MVRYAYGDRRYFALRQTGPFAGIAALFWPTQAVLGRQRMPGPLSPGALSREIRALTEDVVYLEVDAAAARWLMARLDGLFEENAPHLLYNASLDMWRSGEHTTEIPSLQRISNAVSVLY